MNHSRRRLSVLPFLLSALLLAGCAAADKNQTGTGSTSGMKMGGSTSGMNMGSSANAALPPKINGVPLPVAMRELASADWQGMKIQVQTTTPVRFVTFTGAKEQMIYPPKGSSFHLMVMLNDEHTGEPIPYSSSVWATITNSKGKVVFNHMQWPMISAYMGPHFGDDVPDLTSGRYKLTVLVGPQTAARTSEYKGVWLKTHTMTLEFEWDAKTRSATVISVNGSHSSGASSATSMSDMSASDVHTNVSVNGVKSPTSHVKDTAYWQGMKIQTLTAAPTPIYISEGTGEKTEDPAAGSSFYMMVKLTDQYTSEPVTYAPVDATIKSSAGKVVYSGVMQPTISAFTGPYYGNNVKLPGPGEYKVTLRINPPRQARHLEYQHVWLKAHTVVEYMAWDGKQ